MAGRISVARVKSKWPYTIEEAAEVVGATPQTIRTWIKNGLAAMTAERPFLILGCALIDYVTRAEVKRKRPLRIGEFFCLHCKAAREPALSMADYLPRSEAHGLLQAFCAVCEGPCNRLVSRAQLPAWEAICEIVRRDAGQD